MKTMTTYSARLLAVLLTLLCMFAVLPLTSSAADSQPTVMETARVYDGGDLLSSAEMASLTDHMDTLTKEHGVEFYMATYAADYFFDDFTGDYYCRYVRNLRGTNAVLLIVTYERANHNYYYDLYTYGAATSKIRSAEVNYILDAGDVYGNIKYGNVAAGSEAFFTHSAEAYAGRVGAPYAAIIVVSALIAIGIGIAVAGGVVSNYRRRQPTVEYPLDRYATLNLTESRDEFAGKSVTRVYSPRSSGGGGGSRHGGGSHHRGGR